MRSCKLCDLHKNRTQVVVGDIGPVNGICFIGEAPGYYEDKQGRPFVGRSGKLLDEMLASIGYSRTDISVLNICKCRPPDNRTPTRAEMRICGKTWLEPQLNYLKPKIIITLGNVPLQYFFPGERITRNIGDTKKYNNTIIFPIYHPSYILRNGNSMINEYKKLFERIKKIIDEEKKSKIMHNDNQSEKYSDLDEFF